MVKVALTIGTVVVSAILLAGGCAPAIEPLKVEGRTVVVLNDTGEAWKSVEVWVNDHYRVTKETMLPDERFVAPLENFVAGFGQRFPGTQNVASIEVKATDASGDPVRLLWGSGGRR